MPSNLPQPAFETPMQLGESPLWSPGEATLYWIDIPGRAVHRLHPASGAHRQWPMPSEPGCIALCDGGLVVALRSGLAFLDTERGQLSPFLQAPYDTGTTRFNDGRCDAAGRLWVGTLYEPRSHPLGTLFCIERGRLIDARHPVTVSNGVAFSPDARTFYHADTTAHRITAYDFDVATGTASNPRLFRQFSTDRTANYDGRPDGAAVDSEGAYWCAMMEGSRVLRLAPSGEIMHEIHLPVRCPTMVAFGGDDLRTLYITTARYNRGAEELERHPLSGCLLSLRVDVAGQLETPYLR